eukprot:2912312-Lingulodinium_polyedra.AAC.1
MEAFFWFLVQRGYNVAAGRHLLYGWLHSEAAVPIVAGSHLEGPQKALRGWSRLLIDQSRD